jgi:hypothetical protein
MAVSVLIPFRPTDVHRQRALDWVLGQFERQYPRFQVIVQESERGPWSKGELVERALRRATGDVIVVADGDVWTAGLERAVQLVADGDFHWALPQLWVYRLTEAATARVYGGAGLSINAETVRVHKAVRGGGCVVLDRPTIERIPMDPRFVGWGGEDIAWGKALSVLAGDCWRARSPLYHLWHPPALREDEIAGSAENAALLKRYTMAKARSSWPEKMQEVIDEVLAGHPPTELVQRASSERH